MEHTTYLDGVVTVEPPLNDEEREYLNKFSNTRRMDRKKGPYYCGKGMGGQDYEDDIRDYNHPPVCQPGLWCHWIPTEDGNRIEWDSDEKFYEAAEWLQYLIDHFIGKYPLAKERDPEEFGFLQGHVVNGTICAVGEESNGIWRIVVEDNFVHEEKGNVVHE